MGICGVVVEKLCHRLIEIFVDERVESKVDGERCEIGFEGCERCGDGEVLAEIGE